MHRSDSGFTLLEVLVAFAITAVAMAALIKAVSVGLDAAHQSGRYQEALSRARSHLAALNADIDRMTGIHDGNDGSGYHWQIDVRPFGAVPGVSTVPPANIPMLYDVTVTISWKDGRRPRAISLTSEMLGQKPQ